MIDQRIQALADKYAVPLKARSVTWSHFWSGKNLGLFWQQEDWPEDLEEPTLLPALLPIPTASLAHEIFHHVIAEPYQRDFPEYGLCWPTWERGANGNMRFDDPESCSATRIAVNGLLDEEEQNNQERQAQLLTWEWMVANQIPFNDHKDIAPLSVGTWSDNPKVLLPCLALLREKGFSFPNQHVWANL